MFYAIRNFFRGPGAPTRDEGLQSSMPSGYSEASAVPVTVDSAMQVSAVWAAVRVISETIASMPFELYSTRSGTREPATDHPLWQVLKEAPNRYQTDVEFWESMVMNLVLSGNAYAIIERVGDRIVSIMPVSSAQVETTLLHDGTITHAVTSGADVKVYSQRSMWHVKLFGNGIVGMSPLAYARQSVGIALATDNRVSQIHRDGAKPSGVLSIDKTLTKEQRDAIRENYKEMQSGNDDRLFVLEAGMQYHQVSMTPKDIEMMDSRRFQIEDIGRFFGVPSILLNQTFGQSSLGSNVFEIMQAFYKLNLRPYLEKFEASILRWLIDEDGYEAEFDFDALLRSDRSARMEANQKAINSGQLTLNEARDGEGLPPLDGGDTLLVQGAMIPATSAGNDDGGSRDEQ